VSPLLLKCHLFGYMMIPADVFTLEIDVYCVAKVALEKLTKAMSQVRDTIWICESWVMYKISSSLLFNWKYLAKSLFQHRDELLRQHYVSSGGRTIRC
jgi:hypothetical protein